MALEINDLRKPADGAFYVSPERLYITADGELCEESDPSAAFLLVAKGGTLPTSEARRYGLIAEKGQKAVEDKGRKGVANKEGDAD